MATKTTETAVEQRRTSRRLDVIIFGATGFTGAAAVYEAVKLLDGLRWGIAGRNESKLREVLSSVSKRVDRDLSASVSVVLADVADEESLLRMAEETKLIVNCCGPYRFFGEPVVRACIAAGTHHLDVSGEPQFIERMQLLHDPAARAAGCYVISACGFDSIPADLGVIYTEQQFGNAGRLNGIESYMRTWKRGGHGFGDGALVNYGTWESAVHGIAHRNELQALRAAQQKIDDNDTEGHVPKPELPMIKRGILHRAAVMKGRFALPHMGADRAVALRSQRTLFRLDGKHPVQFRAYVAFDSWLYVVVIALWGIVFAAMARFDWGRQQLLQHPKLFSGGIFSREGPTQRTQERTQFSWTFRATGWRSNDAAARGALDKTLVTRVSGTNPGYGATCVSLLLAAKVILTEAEKVRGSRPGCSGGVVTPGAAFAKTSLIEQLSKNGFTFEVLDHGTE